MSFPVTRCLSRILFKNFFMDLEKNSRESRRRGEGDEMRARRGRLDEPSRWNGVMDERGPVFSDEPRRTDMFIRRLSVKVAVALLSCSSFVNAHLCTPPFISHGTLNTFNFPFQFQIQLLARI